MKSVKEFIYLSKNANLFYAIYYSLYKFRLKFYNSSLAINYRKRKIKRLEKIYEHLSLLNNNYEIINGQKLIVFYSSEDISAKIYLRPFSSDMLVYSQIIMQKSYQPIIDIYKQVFKLPPINLIDLGANIGLTSIFFANNFNDLEILAIEPFKENAEIAELNMKSSNLKNYKLIHGGIWNKKVKLSMRRDFRDGKEWGINLVEDGNGEVEGYSIKEICNEYSQIDILKIDIEGAERVLFENATYASEFLCKIKCIAMEIHDEFNCRNLIYENLNNNNFIYYDIQDMTIAINKRFI